jgi:hypothetical protein
MPDADHSHRVISPHAAAVLHHHAFQGDTNDCGPCCAAMVMGAASQRVVAAAALARQMDRPVWRGPWPMVRRVPRSATFPWGIVDALAASGIPACWRLGGSVEALRGALLRGHLPLLVIGNWRPFWIHWVILLGWDPRRGWGVADPSIAEAKIEWRCQAQFERWWQAFGRIQVLAKPGPTSAP